jgi:hypothetical protein
MIGDTWPVTRASPLRASLPPATKRCLDGGTRQRRTISMTFDSFVDLMDSVFLPQKRANPVHIRLDGRKGGGNRLGVGRFWHNGKV